MNTIRCMSFGMALAWSGWTGIVFAQHAPADAVMQIFLWPADTRLYLLARVPLRTLPEISFPQRPPGLVDLSQVDDARLPQAATLGISDKIEVYESGTLLADPLVDRVRISSTSDRAFEQVQTALAELDGPKLPESTEVALSQGALEVEFEYPIRSPKSQFSVRAGNIAPPSMPVLTVLEFDSLTGARRYEFSGDPGVVLLDPGWSQAVRRFFAFGFLHILQGIDSVLLLFCLVMPFRRFAALIPVAVCFTLAHWIGFIAPAFYPGATAPWLTAPIGMMSAALIVYLALENLAVSPSQRRRCVAALGCGLIWGFGDWLAFRNAEQFAGSHSLASLLSFVTGVESGQILVVAILIPMLEIVFQLMVAERIGTILLSALAAHTAWHWAAARAAGLNSMGLRWPFSAAIPKASSTFWFICAAACVGLISLAVKGFYPRRSIPKGTDAVPAIELAPAPSAIPEESE